MKTLAFFLFACLFLPPASFAQDASCGERPASFEELLLKKQKVAFDEVSGLGQAPTASCVGPGYRCNYSHECCGSSFCRDNVCSDNGNSCREPGAACRYSHECCGSSFCRDGYCGDNGNSCRGEGARCNYSHECCGSLFCRDNFCR